jgi:hypothetical protein
MAHGYGFAAYAKAAAEWVSEGWSFSGPEMNDHIMGVVCCLLDYFFGINCGNGSELLIRSRGA